MKIYYLLCTHKTEKLLLFQHYIKKFCRQHNSNVITKNIKGQIICKYKVCMRE